jgi:hypothetical protein
MIVDFLGSRRLVVKPYEVLNVAARFLAVPRGVIRIERACPTTTARGLSASILSIAASQSSRPFLRLGCLFKFQNSLLAGDSTRFGDEENQKRLLK